MAIWSIGGPILAGGIVYGIEESRYVKPRTVTITGVCPPGEDAVGAFLKFVIQGGHSGRFIQPPELEQIPGHSNEARFTEQVPDNASRVTASIGCDFVLGTQHGTEEGEWAHNDQTTNPDGSIRWLQLDGDNTDIKLVCSNFPNTAGRPGTGTMNGSCDAEPFMHRAP